MDIKTYNDDCFNILPTLEKDSVDMVLVDLPYNQTSCAWDCKIDLDKMWIELKKICKKKCIFVFFTTTKFGYKLIQSNPKWFRYDLVWEKSRKVGFLSANKMPLRKHEMVYIFNKEKGTYNPQMVEGKPYKSKRGHCDAGYYREGENATYNFKDIDNKGTRYPSTILKYSNPHKTIHKTQKPVDLCEWLIKSYSNEGDLVLDFTAGSMTTGEACINTKRKCILIEKDEDIYKKGKQRIDKLININIQ